MKFFKNILKKKKIFVQSCVSAHGRQFISVTKWRELRYFLPPSLPPFPSQILIEGVSDTVLKEHSHDQDKPKYQHSWSQVLMRKRVTKSTSENILQRLAGEQSVRRVRGWRSWFSQEGLQEPAWGPAERGAPRDPGTGAPLAEGPATAKPWLRADHTGPRPRRPSRVLLPAVLGVTLAPSAPHSPSTLPSGPPSRPGPARQVPDLG